MIKIIAFGIENRSILEEWRKKPSYKWIVLGLVWSLSTWYVAGFYDRGWVPHDEGALAQSAERVLIGELPHRDFNEIYSGGLTFVHAVAFKLLGANLISLRLVLLLFFLAFVPAIYLIALRLASPDIAAMVTILAVAWSVPNYFASVPSWYNLFFTVFGILAILWHIETGSMRWLFVAGVLGGLSIIVKIIGLYYLAAGILFLAFREQQLAPEISSEPRRMSRWYFLLEAIALTAFVGTLITMLRWRLGFMGMLHFVLPQIAICAVILFSEWQRGQSCLFVRTRNLFSLLLPFLSGALIPIGVFASVYLWYGSIGDLYHGIFVLPQSRMTNAAADFPSPLTIITSLPYAILIFHCFPAARSIFAKVCGSVLIIALGLMLIFANVNLLYYSIWQSTRPLGVVAVLTGTWFLVKSARCQNPPTIDRQLLFLLLSMTALFGLVQFPFAGPIYFIYTTPLVCLALLAVIAAQHNMPKLRHIIALLFYFLFATFWTNGYVWAIGVAYVPFRIETPLAIQKGQLRVIDDYNRLYTNLVAVIRRHSTSKYIYAAPDCPEVYFLSGKQNPTRNIFDFFDTSYNNPQFVTEILDRQKINLVVINNRPQFSQKIESRLFEVFESLFPVAVDIGHFTVRYKE